MPEGGRGSMSGAAGGRLPTQHMRRRLSTAQHLPTLAPAVPHQRSTAQHRAATCHSHKAFCGPLNTGYVPAVQRNKFSVRINAGYVPAGNISLVPLMAPVQCVHPV